MPWAAPLCPAPRNPSQLGRSGPLLSAGPWLGPLSRGLPGCGQFTLGPKRAAGWAGKPEARCKDTCHLPPPGQASRCGGRGGCSRAGTDLEAQGLPDRTCGCRGPRPFLSCSSAPWGGPALTEPLTHGSGRSHRASSVLRLTRPTADRPPGHGLHVRSRNQPDLRSRFSSYLTLD